MDRPAAARLGHGPARVVGAVRHRGVGASLAVLVEEAVGLGRYGRATAGTIRGEALDDDPEHHALETVRYRTVRRAFGALPPEARAGGLLDLGCGRGRVLACAARAGFAPVLGVEVVERLADDARRATAGTGVEVVHADATTFDVPAEVSTVFLFNPFGARSVRSVADRLDDTQLRRPRPLWLVYATPIHQDGFTERGFAVRWSDPDVVILERGARYADAVRRPDHRP